MIKRMLTGLVLLAIVIGFFLLRNIDVAYFELLVLLLIVLGTFEITRAFKNNLSKTQIFIVLVYSILIVPMYSLFSYNAVIFLFVLSAIIGLLSLVFDRNNKIESVGLMFFCLVYPALLLSSLLKINDFTLNSTIALLLVFIIVPATDTFAFIVGCSVKGKKLCPTISPNKTISGAIGGLFGGMLASFVIYLIFKNSFIYNGKLPEIVLFLIIGLLGAGLTIIGDLVESVIKRKVGVKDMGKILPGHGGLLDRIDGFIFASVFIFAFFELIVNI